MLETYQELKLFISSPGDVQQERTIAESVIQGVNRSCRDTLGIHVEAHKWENIPPLTPGMPEQRIQEIINEEVQRCNGFVLILYKRYGKVEPGQTKSNTEREVEVALKMLADGKKIMFLSYFKQLPRDADMGAQERKVRRLRRSLEDRGVFYSNFKNPRDFQDRFTHDLYHTILRFHASRSKQRIIKRFWQLGLPEGSVHPRLAIVYPPVNRHFMREDKPDRFWLNRLLPHVVFEDFKALQKIEKTLRIIGFRDFHFYNIQSIPNDMQKMNRMWICLPRSELAQRQLALYKRMARFSFIRKQNKMQINWRKGPRSSKCIVVQSPLEKYLKIQRNKIAGGEWAGAHGRIYAKDFAVLARFSESTVGQTMASGTLKDFFLAGIRGLGTWGAGWFIDRRYSVLQNYCHREDADIQLLLEVTYKNERILNVVDVSNKSESYFKKENNLQTIKKRIRENT